jgi:N-acetylmuramoyl-L-alanine amidase
MGVVILLVLLAGTLLQGFHAAGAHSPTTPSAPAASTITPTTAGGSSSKGGSGLTSASTDGSTRAKPLAGKVIVIDPGHNMNNSRYPAEVNRLVPYGEGAKSCDTTGTAANSGYTEAEYNLTVARMVVTILRSEGARVVMTPVDRVPWGPCITERAALGNRLHADAALSIHADGAEPSVHGFFVIAPTAPIPSVGLTAAMISQDVALGAAMIRAYHAATGLPTSNLHLGGWLRSNGYGGTDLSHVPKVFIETGEMRNASDAAKLESPTFRRRAAIGIANGIRLFLTGHP